MKIAPCNTHHSLPILLLPQAARSQAHAFECATKPMTFPSHPHALSQNCITLDHKRNKSVYRTDVKYSYRSITFALCKHFLNHTNSEYRQFKLWLSLKDLAPVGFELIWKLSRKNTFVRCTIQICSIYI